MTTAPTRVGVLGSGAVGQTLARGFASRGHDVTIGSRDPSSAGLTEWLAGDGSGIAAADFAATAEHGEIIVLAVKGMAVEEAIEIAGPASFAGKVVIDTTNPLDFSQGMPPRLAWAATDSGGEHVQRAIPDAKVVKAFNTIGSPYFVDPSFPGGALPTMLIAGDDPEAKAVVSGILEDFGWPPAVDAGGIESSRELESLCILWVKLGARRGAWDHGFALLTGS